MPIACRWPSGLVRAAAFAAASLLTGSNAHAADAFEEVLFDVDSGSLAAAQQDPGARVVTVLIPYDRARFFLVDGEPHGFEYELVEQYRKYYNERRGKDALPMDIVYVPTPFSELVPLLASGVGDIAAGGLTITDERAAEVAFSAPYFADVREIVVAHAGSAASTELQRAEDLAGRSLLVASGTSYVEHLQALSEELVARGLEPIEILQPNTALMSTDLLEMVNAGIVDLTVIDEHLARLWAKALPNLKLLDDVAVGTGGRIAWAIGAAATELEASINAFMEETKKGTLLGNILFKRYFEDAQWVSNPLTKDNLGKLQRYRQWFRQYGERYGIDWQLLAALSYKESRFDPNARNGKAIGLMQVEPESARDMGFEDISTAENNIHAGAKYLAHLRDTYFDAPGLDQATRMRFALAAYNAGPGRIRGLRKAAAEQMQLDPDKWFFNVERAAANAISPAGPYRYVRDISKYRLAYRLRNQLIDRRSREREALQVETD